MRNEKDSMRILLRSFQFVGKRYKHLVSVKKLMSKVASKMLILNIFALFVLVVSANADCGVVSKNDWDGLTSVHVEYLPRPVDLVIIQHTVTSTCNTDVRCAEIVRSIQSNHMENLNYWDIGSNFIVGGNGKIYEGPGWLHVGAHTYGYNQRAIGITFIGNYNSDTPTRQSIEAVKALLQCGVENGHLSPNYHVVAHRQLIATESPGRKLYNEIRRWPRWLENVKSIKN